MSRDFSENDERFMRRALLLAARGRGRVEPNPMVGCLLVRNGRVVGEGYHHAWGGPHAEVHALRQAGPRARGATAYVTLEPCSHFGKTPPCTEALLAAGVSSVVAAHGDPFPEVAGRGFRRLRRAGVDVRWGLLAAEAAELNAPFLTRILLHRPYVIAKWAQSLDGKIATRTGESKWITGPEARRWVHRLRGRVDAVMVGRGTVLADDPLLTARDVAVARIATRVVFDSDLRLPLECRLVQTAREAPLLVLTASRSRSDARKRRQLESRGVRVVVCRRKAGQVSIGDALTKLAQFGFTNVLLEGGGELTGSFLDAGLIDEAHVFVAPLLVGGREAPSGCGGRGAAFMGEAVRARVTRRSLLGTDALTTVRLTRAPGA